MVQKTTAKGNLAATFMHEMSSNTIDGLIDKGGSMHRRSIFGSLLLLLIVPIALASGGERRFEKKFSVSAGGTLRVTTDVGSVRIEGTSANEISVVAQLKGRDRDVNDFDITAEQTAGGVDVKGKARGKRGWFWNSMELDAQFVIQVPREYNLEVHTSGGDIDINSLKGTVRGETSGGNITVGSVDGRVAMETSGGNIRVDKVNGDTKMETSGGNIEIGAVKGDVDINTSGGDIHLNDVDGRVRAETSGGSIHVKVSGANRGVYAETSGGDIEVMVGKNVGADIDAETSGGDVVCDLPVTVSGRINESSIRGKVNGGGNKIYAHTSGGDVRIRATP
jgi:DUF4097 and DUF4098 domain-containing protein YvlB